VSRTEHARKPRYLRVAWRFTSAGMAKQAAALYQCKKLAQEEGKSYRIEADDDKQEWKILPLGKVSTT
jgi:hypothetical protein